MQNWQILFVQELSFSQIFTNSRYIHWRFDSIVNTYTFSMDRSDVEEIIEIIKAELKAVDSECFAVPVGGYRYDKHYL